MWTGGISTKTVVCSTSATEYIYSDKKRMCGRLVDGLPQSCTSVYMPAEVVQDGSSFLTSLQIGGLFDFSGRGLIMRKSNGGTNEIITISTQDHRRHPHYRPHLSR